MDIKIRVSILLIMVALGSAAHAEAPGFSKNSIAPVYGKWTDTQGIHPTSYNAHWIGPHWVTFYPGNSKCSYRLRYQIVRIENVADGNSVEIDLRESHPLLGKNLSLEKCGFTLPEQSFVSLQFDVTMTDWIVWSECTTEEEMRRFKANPDSSRNCYTTSRAPYKR
jgi:hypothetical protein